MKEELQTIRDERFKAWFDENYPEKEWREKIVSSAKKGYSAMRIDITEGTTQEEFLMLSNPLFLKSMKKMFTDLDVKIVNYTKREVKIYITGARWENVNHQKLIISWE